MRYLLLGILVVGSVGCTIEVVVRDPVPVKDMFLRAGEDQLNNAQRVVVVPSEDEVARAKREEEILQEILQLFLREARAAKLKEQI